MVHQICHNAFNYLSKSHGGFMKILIPVFILLVMFNSCKENPTSATNQPPNIESISFNPASVTPGGQIQVTSVVTDKEGDQITYTWTTSQGTISEPNKSTTLWTISPQVPVNQDATIKLTVTDGKSSTIQEKSITVQQGITVSGLVVYASSTIPISGATVNIGPRIITTSSDGEYSIDNIGSGSNKIIVTKTGYDTYETTVNVSSTNRNFNLPLTSSTETKRLYGTIKTTDNITLSGVRVSILNPDITESGLSDVSDANGNFQITAVPQGTRNIKLTNVSNPNLCKEVTYEVFVANFDKNYSATMKILRIINFADKNAIWESWEGYWKNVPTWENTYWLIKSDSITGPAIVRLKNCISIPLEAEYYSNPMIYTEVIRKEGWQGAFIYDHRDCGDWGTGFDFSYINANSGVFNLNQNWADYYNQKKNIIFSLYPTIPYSEWHIIKIEFKYYY